MNTFFKISRLSMLTLTLGLLLTLDLFASEHSTFPEDAASIVEGQTKRFQVEINLYSEDDLELSGVDLSSIRLTVPEDFHSSESYATVINCATIKKLQGVAASIFEIKVDSPTKEMIEALKPLILETSNLEVFSTCAYCFNDMDIDSYETIAQCLPQWEKVRVLDFTGCNFGDEAADFFLPKLYGNSSIEVLNLAFDNWQRNIILSGKSSKHITELLHTCPTLMAFNLAGTFFIQGYVYQLSDPANVKDFYIESDFNAYFSSNDVRLSSKGSENRRRVFDSSEINLTAKDIFSTSFFKESFLERNLSGGLYHGVYYVVPFGFGDYIQKLTTATDSLKGINLHGIVTVKEKLEHELSELKAKQGSLPRTQQEISERTKNIHFRLDR